MQRPTAVKVTLAIVGLVIGVAVAAASATALTLPSVSLMSPSAGAGTNAGAPTATNVLLCGMYTAPTDHFSGKSSIDHPTGGGAMGYEYQYANGDRCTDSDYSGAGSMGMFSWTSEHTNVNTTTERGTEHGLAMLSSDMNKNAGFNGRVTNYDFDDTPDQCSERDIYYASGHSYDATGACSPSGPGNFNTHGGAASGDHFRGMYGTVVYQDTNDSMSPCQTGSPSYCFEAILKGQTN